VNVKRLGFWHKRTRKTEKENKKWEKIGCLTVRDSLKKGENDNFSNFKKKYHLVNNEVLEHLKNIESPAYFFLIFFPSFLFPTIKNPISVTNVLSFFLYEFPTLF
jgi:hypothetical protein